MANDLPGGIAGNKSGTPSTVEDTKSKRRVRRGQRLSAIRAGGQPTIFAFRGTPSGVKFIAFVQQPQTGQTGSGNNCTVTALGILQVRFTLRDSGGQVVGAPAVVQVVNGQASFSFQNPAVGSGYYVVAEDVDDPTQVVASSPFSVTAGATLIFTTQPVSGVAGTTGSVVVQATGLTQVRFQIYDQANQPVGGSAVVNVVGGTATWNFTYPQAGSGYYIKADNPNGTGPSVNSTAFATTPADTLVVTVQPGDGPQGATNGITVQATGLANVRFQLKNSAGVVVNQATVPVVGGLASWSFTNPSQGSGYYITADDPTDGFPTVNSATFNVTPAQAITFITQPTSGNVGEQQMVQVSVVSLSQVRFRLFDSNNSQVGNAEVVNVSGGFATWTFTNPAAGSGYYVRCDDPVDGEPSANSVTFTTAPAPSITWTVQPEDGLNEGVQNSGTVAVQGLANVRFQIKTSVHGDVGAPATVAVTGGSASWSFTNPPAGSGYYVLADDPTDGTPSAASASFSTVATGGAGSIFDDLMLEDGGYLLQEDGSYILL